MSGKRVVVITGLSGSGKSSAARALEDEGFFVVDNLPLALLPELLDLVNQGVRFTSEVAVVIDVRNRDFLAGFETTLQQIVAGGHALEIYFFDASDEVLIRRYSETRRRHPLGTKDGVIGGIIQERQLLQRLRELATEMIDTSLLTPHQLRARVVQIVHGQGGGIPLAVHLQSFGFRYGIPASSDMVMDVRFLPNPHFVPELQPLSGLDAAVSDFVLSQEGSQEFLRHFKGFLAFLIPQFQAEGKSYLTISIGCTGGRHRSVAIVEELKHWLAADNLTLQVSHRDIAKR